MSLLRSLSNDRRVVLLALNGALAIVLGFATFTPDQSLQIVIYGGYWAMLGLTAWFIYALARLVRDDRMNLTALCASARWPAALIIVSGGILLVHESYGFKILMDEAMLLGTSMTMHFEKAALVPMRGNDIQGAFQLLNGELDKRPLFHPFLVSLLHDITGYRPENAFILNTALTFVLLGLAYHVGRRIGGKFGGTLTVLLLTGLPLLAQNATGGGFELLNLVMIVATMTLAMRWLDRPDANSLTAMILCAVLLANTRYESVLFLLPVAFVIALGWTKERRSILSITAAFAPFMMLPYALHNTVFRSRASAWELASRPGYEKPFSLGYLPENFGHALEFFFNTDGTQSNSLTIAALGFVAVPFFVLWCINAIRAPEKLDPARRAVAAFAVGFFAHAVLLMCYFWGKFDDPVIRRLSLPLNLGLVLATVAVAAEFGRAWVWRTVTIIAIVGLFTHSLPSMARHDYTLDYYVGREGDWKREFITAHPERDYLVLDDNSIFWITHCVSSTPIENINERKEILAFNLRNRTFSAMYVFQGYNVDPTSGMMSVVPADDLGPAYELETVWERRFTLLHVSRISRIKSIRDDAGSAPRPAPPPMENLTPAEREKARQSYFERFFQKLP